jgi:hypothetical protein
MNATNNNHAHTLSPAPPHAIRYNRQYWIKHIFRANEYRIEQRHSMAIEIASDQAIWVTTREGAELTGYNRQYLEKLAKKNWRVPEDERLIKIRNRSRRYELWLPDLLRYIEEIGYGPHQDKK